MKDVVNTTGDVGHTGPIPKLIKFATTCAPAPAPTAAPTAALATSPKVRSQYPTFPSNPEAYPIHHKPQY